MTRIHVLRLGHRPGRDKRLTTHVALTARAFGADRVLLTRADPRVVGTLDDVNARFGGEMAVEVVDDWQAVVEDWPGTSVHLTMYGQHVDEVGDDLGDDDLLVVVGAGKVPRDVYDRVDVNVAVGNQPHSEVAALAVLLDRALGPDALRRGFEGEIRVEPHPRGKRVVKEVDHGQPERS